MIRRNRIQLPFGYLAHVFQSGDEEFRMDDPFSLLLDAGFVANPFQKVADGMEIRYFFKIFALGRLNRMCMTFDQPRYYGMAFKVNGLGGIAPKLQNLL